MLKRVFAWVLLVGFILLLLNIAFFKIYWELSAMIYAVVAVGFIFSTFGKNQHP